MLPTTLPFTLLLSILSHHALAQSSSVPRIDFSRMGTVGVAGNFAGLSLFSSANASSANPLASTLLARSAADGSLSVLGATEDGGRITAACELDSKLYIAGEFSQVGSTTSQNVVSFDLASNAFSSLPNGGLNGPVNALYCDTSNHVVWVGGNFTYPVSSTSPSFGGAVILYTPSNSSWTPAPFYGLEGNVLSIMPSPSSQSLYFAGSFLTSFSSNTTNNTFGNNPNVPYSSGATPYSSSLVPVPLAGADLTAGPATTQSGFTDISSILCPAGADGAGNTWLAADGQVAQITVRVYKNEMVSGMRLGNTFVQGRGTTAFTVTAIPSNEVLSLTYYNPQTNSTGSCTSPCPLLTTPSVPYQDFLFGTTPPLTLTGFQLTLNTYTGAGAGLHILQLLSSGTGASFVAALNEPASCFSPGPSAVTESGTWTEVNVTTSTPGTTQPILRSVFPITTAPASAPSLNLSVYTSAVGLYTAYMLTPGCTQMQDCAQRTTVQVSVSPGDGSPAVTQEIDQRVTTDTLQQIYRGPLYPVSPSFSIPVSLSLSPTPAGTGDGTNYDIVADQVQFVLTAAPGLSGEGSVGQGVPGYNATMVGGVQRGWGVFEWPLAGGSGNASAMLPNSSVTPADEAGVALYSALFGSATTVSAAQLAGSGIAALAASSSVLALGGTFALPALNISNLALWNGTALRGASGPAGAVAALALDPSANQLYVGGSFPGGVARYDLGANQWNALGGGSGGVDGAVLSLALNGSQLTIGGNFTALAEGGIPAAGLAIYNTSTGAFVSPTGLLVGEMSLATEAYLAGSVRAIAAYAADGWAMLGANSAGQTVVQPVDGVQLAQPSASTTPAPSAAVALALRSGKRHLDWFRRVFGARQAAAGQPAALPPPPPAPAPAVLAGTFWKNGSDDVVCLGGNFSFPPSSSSSSASAVALYDPTTGAVRSLQGAQLNGTARALLVAGSTLIVGGEFAQAGSQVDGLAMYDLGAGEWVTAFQALQPMTGSTVVVRSLTAVPSSPSIVIVAGSFASAGSLTCQGVCAWDTSAKQWNALGGGIKGEVAAVDYAGSDSNLLIVAGSLALADGTLANVLEYNIGNSTWSVLGARSDLPGPATAVSVDNYNSSSIFVAGRTADDSAPYFSHWDGTRWTALDGTLQGTSSVSQLAIVPLLDNHGTNSFMEGDRMLLVSGSLASSSFGNVSSALFDGQTWHPYLAATTAAGTTGAISSLFYSASSNNLFTAQNFLAVGLVILISIVIGAGIVFALFLIGVLLALCLRRRDDSHQLLLTGEKDDDDSSMHRPSSLLEHVQAATRATMFGPGALAATKDKGRSAESTPEMPQDDSMETDDPPHGAAGAEGAAGAAAATEGRSAFARYSFDAAGEGELPVRAGTQVLVLDDRDDSWWYARDPNTGQEGIVPASYFY